MATTIHPPTETASVWNEIRLGVSKLINHIPPEYELAIHRVRNQFEPIGILYSRDPVVIARWVEQNPHDDYLIETDLVRAGSQEVADVCGRPERRPWSACFLIEAHDGVDEKDTRSRLMAVCGVLTCIIIKAYPKIQPFLLQDETGLWCVFFDPGLAALPVCCSTIVQERIQAMALRTLEYLTPAAYSINPTSSFAMPREAVGWNVQQSEIQAIVSKRQGWVAA